MPQDTTDCMSFVSDVLAVTSVLIVDIKAGRFTLDTLITDLKALRDGAAELIDLTENEE